MMVYWIARPKPVYGYVRQPPEAFIGLIAYKNDCNQEKTQLSSAEKSRDEKDKLAITQKGFSHTGCQVGLNYKRPAYDPRFNTRRYGNEKPSVINFSYK